MPTEKKQTRVPAGTQHELAIAIDALREIAWAFDHPGIGGLARRIAEEGLRRVYPTECRQCRKPKLMSRGIEVCCDCNPVRLHPENDCPCDKHRRRRERRQIAKTEGRS